MTILEFCKKADANTIATAIVNEIEGSTTHGYGFDDVGQDSDHFAGGLGTFSAAFNIGYCSDYFNASVDCCGCEYLETDNTYEDYWVNGQCSLAYRAKTHSNFVENLCPRHINRFDIVKKQIVNWLNSEIE